MTIDSFLLEPDLHLGPDHVLVDAAVPVLPAVEVECHDDVQLVVESGAGDDVCKGLALPLIVLAAILH